MLSLEEYENLLSSILIPPALHATASSEQKPTNGGNWCCAERRDLRHDYYILRTANPDKDRKADRVLWLGDALDFRHGWTGGVTPLIDALSLRIVCIEVLKGNGTAKPVAAAQAVKIIRHLEWVIRWRNALGIKRFQDISQDHYRQFVEDSSTSDITDLVPIVDRLDFLLEDANYQLPLYRHGRRFRMDWEVFANTLGVHRWSIGHSMSTKQAFSDRASSFLQKSGLSPDDVDFFAHATAGRPSEKRAPFHRLNAWDVLERLSLKGLLQHDALSFQPSHIDIRRNRPTSERRTKSLLPRDLHRLVKLSSQWILEYSPYILECLQERKRINPGGKRHGNIPALTELTERMDLERPPGVPALSLALAPKSHFHVGRLLLTTALQYLFVAASIVIGALAGRRRNETGSLRANPIFRRRGMTYLTIYIEKTIQDVDGVPVPELVEHAVNLLHKLSEEARNENGSEWLFQFKSDLADGQTMSVDVEFGKNLLSFVEFCGLEPPEGQVIWKLTYHVLRKGFVIATFHGNLWGSFDATNRALRHWSDHSSRHYMDDDETGALSFLRSEVARITKIETANLDPERERYLKDAKQALAQHDTRRRIYDEGRQEFFVEMHMAVFDGLETPIGKGAVHLLDLLQHATDRAYARIRVAAAPTNGPMDVRADVLMQIKAAAANGSLYPVPGLPLYCNYRKSAGGLPSLAACHRLEAENVAPWRSGGTSEKTSSPSWPSYAFTSLFACLGCEYCILFNANQRDVDNTIMTRELDVRNAATAAIADDAQRYVDDLVRLLTEAREVVDGKQRP